MESKKKDMIKGGRADRLSIIEIAEKHRVSSKDIEYQLSLGIPIEREHTDNAFKAKEIAMDHLAEIPDYYTRLIEMEEKALKELNQKK